MEDVQTEIPKMKKHLSVDEADNGFTVSMYDGKKDRKMVCKSLNEVMAAMEKLMGGQTKKMDMGPSQDETIEKGAVDYFKKNK